MKKALFFVFIVVGISIHAQTGEVTEAKDYFAAFVKDGKMTDLDKAFVIIQKAMSDSKNEQSDIANFFNGLITKQYYESKPMENRYHLVDRASKSFLKTYKLNNNFSQKQQLLKSMQVIGYDLYAEGIKLFKQNNNLQAYESYKTLIDIQRVLADNKLDFSLQTPNGEKATLSRNDILNNLAVFCINGDKKAEAVQIFESEVKRKPTASSYAKLIQLCYQTGDSSSANKYLNEAFLKYPTDEDILIFAINRFISKKDYNNSLQYIHKAIEASPSNKLYLVQAQLLEESGNHEKAQESYKQGIKCYPGDFDLNYNYATLLFNSALKDLNTNDALIRPNAMKKIQEAKNLFHNAQSLNSNKVDINKIIEQIDQIK